jgi:hypothetical protein
MRSRSKFVSLLYLLTNSEMDLDPEHFFGSSNQGSFLHIL